MKLIHALALALGFLWRCFKVAAAIRYHFFFADDQTSSSLGVMGIPFQP